MTKQCNSELNSMEMLIQFTVLTRISISMLEAKHLMIKDATSFHGLVMLMIHLQMIL